MQHAARARPARDIILDEAEGDFDRGLVHLKERFHHHKGGLQSAAAKGVEGLVMGVLTALRVRKRLRRDAGDVVDLALRVHAGEDARSLAHAHYRDVLRLKQAGLFVRVNDPAFQLVLARAEAMFAARLPDLARLATTEGAKDFGDLVRRAFPDRAYPESIVRDNVAQIMDMIAHVERNPHVIRAVPDAWIPKATGIGREFIEWKLEDAKARMDEWYNGSG